MNKVLSKGAFFLLLPFIQDSAVAQDNLSGIDDDRAIALVLKQEEIDEMHKRQSQSFKFDESNPFSYLEQGSVFVPSFLPMPKDFILNQNTWNQLSSRLAKIDEFNSPEKLNAEINSLREKNIRLEFKIHPRLMSFMLANNHLTQRQIDANKDDLIFLLSQENHFIKKEYPNANAFAHKDSSSNLSTGHTPKSVFDQRKRRMVKLVNQFINNYVHNQDERQIIVNALNKLGFVDYNGFAPLTFMQMARDYQLIENPEQFKALLKKLNLKEGKELKINFSINVIADESSDHNACFYMSMINPEKAWESYMKVSQEPMLLKDGSLSIVLGVRENQKDLDKLLDRMQNFFDKIDVGQSRLQLNIMAHGSYDKDSKTGKIHLSSKETEDTLDDSDQELYKKIGKVFSDSDQCHVNFMSCYSGKHIARVISEQILSGLIDDNSDAKEFSFSAPYNVGVFSSSISQEGFTEFDAGGVSTFRFKNYFPSKGTVEYKKQVNKQTRLVNN
jgi:hypothetical protein